MVGASLLLLEQLVAVGNLLSGFTLISSGIVLMISLAHLVSFSLISSSILVVFSYYQVVVDNDNVYKDVFPGAHSLCLEATTGTTQHPT